MSMASIIATETSAYNSVIALTLIPRVHGKPSRNQFKEARRAVIKILGSFPSPYEEHHIGLAGSIMSAQEFRNATDQNDPWIEQDEPPLYDEEINDETSTHERKRMEKNHDEKLLFQATQRGVFKGIAFLLRATFDKKYYQQLEHPITGYDKVTPKQFFQHLDSKWCRLTVNIIKEMKAHYYRPSNPEESILELGKRIEEEADDLREDGIIIHASDQIQFYLEQVKAKDLLDRRDWREYEDLNEGDALSFADTREFFEGLEDELEQLENDENANTAAGGGYQSAAQVTEAQDDENREVLQQLAMFASGQNTANVEAMANMQSQMHTAFAALTEQLKQSNEALTTLKKQVDAQDKPQPRGGRWANVPDGPECKHCGKKHLIPNHWLGSEAECPGRDWPNNIKGHKVENMQWFFDKMNKRTGKNFQKPAGF